MAAADREMSVNESSLPHITRGLKLIASLSHIYRHFALANTRHRTQSASQISLFRPNTGMRHGSISAIDDLGAAGRVSSITRELAFGGIARRRDEKIGFRRTLKGLWKHRCIQRTLFVFLVFLLAIGVYYIRFSEYMLDERLRQEWMKKEEESGRVKNTST